MAATLQVTALEGFVKKIESQYVRITDGFGGAILNAHCQAVNINDYLDIEDDCLLLDAGSSVTLKYIPDATSPDGQGFVKIKSNEPYQIEVSQFSGNVYITRARDIILTDDRSDIYGNPNRITPQTGDKLWDGDYLLCEKQTAWFIIIIRTFSNPNFIPLFPHCQAMPGLDEGVNDINAF